MITLLFTDPAHPGYPTVAAWCKLHRYRLVNDIRDAGSGQYLFMVSCTQIVPPEVRERFERALVLHESALPAGRGWSPLAWQILEGGNDIPISLIECADPVDSGDIVMQSALVLKGHELADEIARRAAEEKLRMIAAFIDNPTQGKPQTGDITYYRRRTPEDSRLSPNATLAEQFDLLRLSEPRYPAFLEHRGHRYIIEIKRA